jgi:Recombination endonuclease VII
VSAPARVCKDCRAVAEQTGTPVAKRPAPHPGPRCATHHRAARRRTRATNAARRTQRVYSLTPDEYDRLYRAQGGRCAICRRAQGVTDRPDRQRRLAVDHDHTCCPGPTSCGRCVRGLLCDPCNREMAHARDDPEHFRRAIAYLREWPALRARI